MNRSAVWIAALLLAGSLPAQEEKKADRPYPLMVGDPSPPLAVQTWVKGDASGALEKGKVTVVEFWATWCGPCIHNMPHLSDLQERYAEKGVKVVGVNIWDDPAKVEPFMRETAPIHDKSGDEIMRYAVAIEEKEDPDDVEKGKMAREWMAAAGRDGIPCAFLVDREGRIAWIGHPASLDEPLAKVVAGEWDLEAEKSAYAARMAQKAKIASYHRLFGEGNYAEAYALGREVVRGSLANDALGLNLLAWNIVDPVKPPKVRDLDLALEAAKRANELTKSEDPHVLDTLAMVHHERKDLSEALRWQRLAAKFAKGKPVEEEVLARLKEFEEESAKIEAAGRKDPEK